MSVWVKARPHTQKKPTEVSSSVLHFLQIGLSLSPTTYKCHLRVLCPVRRPMTTLDCVLLKDNNRALVDKSGLEINSCACLCPLQGSRHITKCWLSIQRLIFLLMFYLETPKKCFGPTNFWTELPLVSLSAISYPRTPACPGICYCDNTLLRTRILWTSVMNTGGLYPATFIIVVTRVVVTTDATAL